MTELFGGQWRRRSGAGVRLPLLLVVAALALSGCLKVGPDYQPIEAASAESWHAELQGGLSPGLVDPATLAEWWQLLADPQLARLEERAVKGNLELKGAQARIREARALRGISSARLWPALDARGGASKSRSSESSGRGLERELFAVGFDAAWELDFFGGAQRSLEASQASFEATREELNDTLVSLLAEVALNYVEVRTYQSRLLMAKATVDALQESYEINASRYRAGLISELAEQESRRLLESSRARLPALNVGLESAKNRLAVLLGEQPGSLHEELAVHQPIPELPVSVTVGIPAETMRHRPDVRRAERNLAAQTARIGVAVADLYPKFRLAGTLGLEAVSAEDLFQAGSRVWSLGPNVSWKLFNAGAVRQNIEVQNARQEQALLLYEATVLRAQEEVENALLAYAQEQLKGASLARAAMAAERAELLARDQYQAGLISFSNVLDAQRSLLLLQDEEAQSKGAATANLVRLYKAFGGGWQPAQPEGRESANP